LELWQHDVTLALSRPVDFFGYDTHVFRGGDPLSPLGVVEKENQFTSPGFATNDVIVDYDATTGSSASPMVEISAVESRADAVWNPIALQAGAYRAPSNFWLRFSASQSVPASGYIPEQLLVRYFWHWGVDVADRTNFANTIGEQDALIRVHQFSAGTHTVRVHVVQPREKPTDPADETSTNYGSVLDLSFNIYSPLTSAITVNSPQPVELGQAASFTAGGGNGAGGNEYRWEFGAGEGVIDWSSNANSSYTFQSTGSKTVTLRKRDSYGYVAVGTTTVNVVQSPPLTASIHGFYANQNGAVRRTQDCEWRADAAGGSGTYTYQWYQDDVLLPGETGRFLWLNTGTASFTVKVVVQSAGQSANGIKSVSVTTNGQICA
jgi:PKD repeat protein